jgi:hypothetical protein
MQASAMVTPRADENKQSKNKPGNSTKSQYAYPLENGRARENLPAKARRK